MTFLYNDAYVAVLSQAKHPQALGRPAREVWSEIWDICGPLADKVFERGEATFVDDVRLFMSRGDVLEETYYSFSYSPIHDESGRVAGLFCPSTETTAKNSEWPKIANALGTCCQRRRREIHRGRLRIFLRNAGQKSRRRSVCLALFAG